MAQPTARVAEIHRFPARERTIAITEVPPWKRMLDLTCIFLLLPALLPLTVLITIVIKLGSAGPVLFKQERVGFRGQRFTIFKFRTMRHGANTTVHEAHTTQLIAANLPMVKLDEKGDTRLIPFGSLLRASGLDELAQILNVLRGEMSLVGPRPCLPAEYECYRPPQRERFNALPGMTGLWQVSGKNRTTFNEMIRLDIDYTRQQSLGLDLKIMLKTLPAVAIQVRESRQARQRPAEKSPPQQQRAA